MKTGRISESILKRSVLRQIKTHRDEVVKGAGVGEDCAFFSWKGSACSENESGFLAASTQTVSLPVKKAPQLAVMAAVNNLASGGAEAFAVTASIALPKDSEEALLKEIMVQLEDACGELNVRLSGGHTEVTPAVNTPVITITALGRCERLLKTAEKKNLDIVVSKWVGMEGTFILAEERRRELSARYPLNMILAAQEMKQYLSVVPEAALALKSGVYMMHDMRNGGIFGALWEISQRIGVGLCIDLKKIPILQETIEVCEFFEINPYQLLSGGALLFLTEDGEKLVETLVGAGINATVIGSTNDSNDKLVINEEETRYLEPPVPDEIYKVFG